MITTYSVIIATTPLQSGIPFCSTLFFVSKILNWRALSVILVGAAWTRMAPAIATARWCFIVREVAFSCYRNVMRASGRWIHVLWNVTTHCEVFVQRKNQIRFHNRFLFSKAG
jgi:hypothetical protein